MNNPWAEIYKNYGKTKKATVYSKKTKIPTASKTIKHKCSQCQRTDAIRYPISEKEFRWLCPVHVTMNNRRDNIEKSNFVRASRL